MIGAREIAATAVDNIDPLVSDMLESGHPDNWVSLGRTLLEGKEYQIQLKITSVRSDFYDSDEEDLIASS
tara:strand:+ start:411 stop:620 length:210 start_codon:yes stop_codon:yes gene_type:complete